MSSMVFRMLEIGCPMMCILLVELTTVNQQLVDFLINLVIEVLVVRIVSRSY